MPADRLRCHRQTESMTSGLNTRPTDEELAMDVNPDLLEQALEAYKVWLEQPTCPTRSRTLGWSRRNAQAH